MRRVRLSPEALAAWHRRWRRRLAAWSLQALALAATGSALVFGCAWLAGSEAGLRWLCAQLEEHSGGRLQISGAGGRLLGDWRVARLRWRDGGSAVAIDGLAASWSPLALARGELAFSRLDAASVRLGWSDEPTRLPDDLRLPLALRVEALRIGRLELAAAGDTTQVPADPGGRPARVVAEAIGARLSSDGAIHRLSGLQARLGPSGGAAQIDVSAALTLAARAPFALGGAAQLHAAWHGQRLALAVDVGGTLARVQLAGRASVDETEASRSPASPPPSPAGELRATLAPFAATPLEALEALQLRLVDLDPALLVGGAPHARLDLEVALGAVAGQSGAELRGRLQLRNRDAGAVDGGRLPWLSLAGDLSWRGAELRLDALSAGLAGGGRLSGGARASIDRLSADLELGVQHLDVQALYGKLPATRLSGPLRVHLAGDAQVVELDWRDARNALKLRARADAREVEVTQLQLAAGGGVVSAQGRLAWAGERRFTVSGRLRDFAPARWLPGSSAVPARALLNAGFETHGVLRPAPAGALEFTLADSRLGGQSLAGHGTLDWQANRAGHADVELQAAGNRLRAQGGFGRAGDALKFTAAAPRLGALGLPGVSGELDAALELAGDTFADAGLTARVAATRLRLGEWFDSATLALDARLGAGPQGTLALELRCTACALAAGVPLTLALSAQGERRAQRLTASVTLPRRRELHAVAHGQLLAAALLSGLPGSRPGRAAAGETAAGWRGTLDELRLISADPAASAPSPLLELTAPAPLSLGVDTLALGPAVLAGRLGQVCVDRLAFAAGRWQSAGRLARVRPQDVLAEFPAGQPWRQALGGAGAPPLTLAGEWDFRQLGATDRNRADPVLGGHAALWRESGDLTLGALPLGLAEARLQASLADGRLAAEARVRGARIGQIDADLAVAVKGLAIDRDAPWQGRLRADLPDLAWLAPLLGDGWQLAGQARGEWQLAGSAAHPRLSGQLRGERLALRALDLGLRLENGEAELDLTAQRLALRRLRFDSVLSAPPPALRLDQRLAAADFARLTSAPGSVEASGELSLAAAAADGVGRLKVRLQRFGAVQRAGQWAVLSGEGELRFSERLLEVSGALEADAAYWALAALDRPALSDDVVVRSAAAAGERRHLARAFKLDVALALGDRAYFLGAGVDSRLAGELRVRSDDAGLPRATGSIRTVDGRFDAYGQSLELERGIVNFQGPIDNPGLNLLAVRKNLQVEAGVEVTGTAQRPQIRLVSSPNVPDAEKLSWLVLGRSPEQQGGDSALLFAAARTLIGGQDGGVLRQLQRSLGIDEFGVASGQIGGLATPPTSHVASSNGFSGSQTVNGQIVTVGKRLTSNALLSYQQSLNSTESVVKLTLSLGRQVSLVGSAGSDSALDVFWHTSFGK